MAAPERRILVVANETLAGAGVVDEVRYRAGDAPAHVTVVAPALSRTRLDHWLSSGLARRQALAEERLLGSLEALRQAGLHADGHLGDADPLQALDDAMRLHEPDEIVISTHHHSRSNWLERQVVRRARQRYAVPITHIVVDLEHESAAAEGDTRLRPAAGRASRIRVFHASDYQEAIGIREHGFRDGGADGVLVTDAPPGDEAGAVVFALDVPEDAVAAYEQPPDGGHRRFRPPADLLNRYGPAVAEGDWSE